MPLSLLTSSRSAPRRARRKRALPEPAADMAQAHRSASAAAAASRSTAAWYCFSPSGGSVAATPAAKRCMRGVRLSADFSDGSTPSQRRRLVMELALACSAAHASADFPACRSFWLTSTRPLSSISTATLSLMAAAARGGRLPWAPSVSTASHLSRARTTPTAPSRHAMDRGVSPAASTLFRCCASRSSGALPSSSSTTASAPS
mmetsp:Transcript_8456/g.21578  ORF Transcript_8456/g.21578 Transcript_8456/m.21578 type:complete len:204 (-) Transcript_8456:255-866(-)